MPQIATQKLKLKWPATTILSGQRGEILPQMRCPIYELNENNLLIILLICIVFVPYVH